MQDVPFRDPAIERVTSLTRESVGTTPRWQQRWPDWVAYAAAVWSLLYGVLGVYWALGGPGFPFGPENDPQSALSILEDVEAPTGGPIIAALGLVGALIAVAMARTRGRGVLRAVMLAFAWIVAAALVLVIPDYRLLMAVAYAPIFLLGAPFGWPPANFFDVITWPVVNQFVCIAGGLCWAGAALAYQRRSRGVCANCGRAGDSTNWTTPANAARWGKWAVAIAVLVPLLYAATRWAWALGIPLGISDELFREGQAIGLWWAGAGLATVAIGGALLTLGLVQRWGEVFPRWIPVPRRKARPAGAGDRSCLAGLHPGDFCRTDVRPANAPRRARRNLHLHRYRGLGCPGPGAAVAALGRRPRRGDARVLLPETWHVHPVRS